MAKISIWDIKQELVVFLRNKDILTISDRGVTTSQDTGTFSAATSHTLSTNPTLVKNIRDITIATNLKTFGTDYNVNYETGVISFTSPETGAFTINYDQGNTDRIFPDFPQAHLNVSDYPRIAVDLSGGATTEIELGGGSNFTDYTCSIACFSTLKDVEELIATARGLILDNKKNFYYFDLITPTILGPIIVNPIGEKKVFQRTQDCNIPYVYEN